MMVWVYRVIRLLGSRLKIRIVVLLSDIIMWMLFGVVMVEWFVGLLKNMILMMCR